MQQSKQRLKFQKGFTFQFYQTRSTTFTFYSIFIPLFLKKKKIFQIKLTICHAKQMKKKKRKKNKVLDSIRNAIDPAKNYFSNNRGDIKKHLHREKPCENSPHVSVEKSLRLSRDCASPSIKVNRPPPSDR